MSCSVVFLSPQQFKTSMDYHGKYKRACDLTSGTERRAARPGVVVPSKAGKRIPVEWRVKTIMDAKVLLPHQHLNRETTKHLKQYQKYYYFFLIDNKDFLFTMTINVMFVGPIASRVSGPSVGRL